MPTVSFRGGCLTGPAHAGTELHGFLSYLMICTVSGRPYRVFGYKGKQVRDNIHSFDLVEAFAEFIRAPRVGEVYNIGGSRQDRKSTRLNSCHANISYAVFCLKKKSNNGTDPRYPSAASGATCRRARSVGPPYEASVARRSVFQVERADTASAERGRARGGCDS